MPIPWYHGNEEAITNFFGSGTADEIFLKIDVNAKDDRLTVRIQRRETKLKWKSNHGL